MAPIAERYSRQVLLKEYGEDGQRAINRARFLVIGAGGLGSPAALCLAEAGAGSITIVDSDNVDETNLARQFLHTPARIGMNKAWSAKAALEEINPDVKVIPVTERGTVESIEALARDNDVVLDLSDNFLTRHAASRAARLARKPLVTASAVRFSGQVMVFDFRRGRSPCYHCIFPEDREQDTKASAVGVSNAVTGAIGMLAAGEALKIAVGIPGLTSRLLMVDTLSLQFQTFGIAANPRCPVCSGQA